MSHSPSCVSGLSARSDSSRRASVGSHVDNRARTQLQTCLRASCTPQQCRQLPPGRSLSVAVAATAAGGAAAPSATSRPGDEYFPSGEDRPIILYDGVCGLCNGGVNFALDWDKDGKFRFAALQSDAGRKLLQRSGRRPDDISSIVLVERGGSYIKAAAVLRIAQRLQVPLPLVAAALDIFPSPLKDFVYDGVAANRYLIFGQTPTCRLSDPRYDDRFLSA